jgi:cytoskeletal protein CcmA (bactofilin family)
MNPLLSILDDALVVQKLNVRTLDGPVTATDDLQVQGSLYVNRDIRIKKHLDVAGTISADTLKVNRIITEQGDGAPSNSTTFQAKSEKELDGKGLVFVDNVGSKQFVFKEGNKMWSTMDIDLARNRSYSIDKIPVLTANSLGSGIVNSNLTKVGVLQGLQVSGQVEIDNWAFFNSANNRLGINTENPHAALNIVENNVEIILGSFESDVAYIGTYNSASLDIGTDHKARISIKNTGEILIGNPKYKTANVKIYGRLEVDELITKTGVEGSALPITYKESDKLSIYGTGFFWQKDRQNRHFIYEQNPDRIWTTEIIDLADDKWYSINNFLVLSRTTLGSSVSESSLTKLGTLRELTVDGVANFNSTVNVKSIKIGQINSDDFSIVNNNDVEFKITANGNIQIGNNDNSARKINMYGQVSVNVTNPDPNIDLVVNNSMSLNNKKFMVDSGAPTTGKYRQGDLVWNNNPVSEGFIGWVCVKAGEPGNWAPFGRIYTDRP